ncbi:MAG: hypothetical protein ABIJ33_02100 [Patescibacteria group bacterium]
MPKSKSRLIQFLTRPRYVALGAMIIASGVILLTTLTVFLARQPLNQSQDIRPQASTTDAQVEITAQPVTNANFVVGQPTTIDLLVNTHGLETAGIQLAFDVIHTHADGLLNFRAQVEGNLGMTTDIQPIDQGFRIQVMALAPVGSPFTTTQPTQLIGLNFTPLRVGQVSLIFDNDQSHSTLADVVPPEDKLATLTQLTYPVILPAQPTPTLPPNATPTPKSCNQVCESSLECANNHYCYRAETDWRCRLADNPISTTCQGIPDQGLHRTCNQYCADSNECTSGLTCWYNKCRLLSNIENTNCTALNSTQQVAQNQLCNAVCSTNADCAINLRCFNGGCRLAVNPTSQICSLPPIQPIVAPQAPVLDKGTVIAPPPATTADSSTSGSLEEVSPTTLPTSEVTQPPTAPPQPNALSELINSLRQSGRLLPVGVLVLGLVLLLASFLASTLGGSQPKARVVPKQSSSPLPTTGPTVTSSPKPLLDPSPPPPVIHQSSPQSLVIHQSSDMVERLKEKGVQPPQSAS